MFKPSKLTPFLMPKQRKVDSQQDRDWPPPSDSSTLLLEPIESLAGFTTRALNVIQQAIPWRVVTVGNLLALQPKDLLAVRNCGRQTIANIQDVLGSYGLAFSKVTSARRGTRVVRRLLTPTEALVKSDEDKPASRLVPVFADHAGDPTALSLEPIEALEGLTVRALNIIHKVIPGGVVTVGEVLALKPEDLLGANACGRLTIANIQEVLGSYGLALKKASRVARHGRTENRVKAKAKEEALVARFKELVSPELLETGSLAAIGKVLNLSRERVRQLMAQYPNVGALRGLGPEESALQKHCDLAVAALAPGVDPRRVIEAAGTKPDLLLTAIKNRMKTRPHLLSLHQAVKARLKMGRDKERADHAKEVADNVKAVAEYAKGKGLSLRGACVALGLGYGTIADQKNKYPELLSNPALKEVLNPNEVIKEKVALARARIVDAGMTLWQACEGMSSQVQTIARHLAGDGEVQDLLRGRTTEARRNPRPFQKTSPDVLEKAKQMLLDGLPLAAVAAALRKKQETLRTYLQDDPEVGPILAAKARQGGKRGKVTKASPKQAGEDEQDPTSASGEIQSRQIDTVYGFTVRALGFLHKVIPAKTITLGDVLSLKPEDLLAMPNCGMGTVTNIQHVLLRFGLFLKGTGPLKEARLDPGLQGRKRLESEQKRGTKREVKARLKAGQKAARAGTREKAAIARFIDKVGLDTIRSGTMDDMAQKLGLTESRVSQILTQYPQLKALRDPLAASLQRQKKPRKNSRQHQIQGPIGQLVTHHGSLLALEKASGISAKSWVRWANNTSEPRGWTRRIAIRVMQEAGITPPWSVLNQEELLIDLMLPKDSTQD